MKEEPEVLFEELLERAKAGEPKAQTEVILYGFCLLSFALNSKNGTACCRTIISSSIELCLLRC